MSPQVRAIFTITEYEGANICSAEIPAVDITNRPCYYAGAGKVKDLMFELVMQICQ